MKRLLLVGTALLSISAYASRNNPQWNIKNTSSSINSSFRNNISIPILPFDEETSAVFSAFIPSSATNTKPRYDEVVQAMWERLTFMLFDPDTSKPDFQQFLKDFKHIYEHLRCYNDQNLNMNMLTSFNNKIENLLEDMKLAENSCASFSVLSECIKNCSDNDAEKVKQYVQNYQQYWKTYVSPYSHISQKFFENMAPDKPESELFAKFAQSSNATISNDNVTVAKQHIRKYIKRYRKGLEQCINQYNNTPEKLSLLTHEFFYYPPISETEAIYHFKSLCKHWLDINHMHPDIYRFTSPSKIDLYPNTPLLHSLSNIWLEQTVLNEKEIVHGYNVFPWEEFRALFQPENKNGGLRIAIIWDYLKEIFSKHMDSITAPYLIKEIIDYTHFTQTNPDIFKNNIVPNIILPYIIQPLTKSNLIKVLIDVPNDQQSVIQTISYNATIQKYMQYITHNSKKYLNDPMFDGLYKILETIFDAITNNQITEYISGKNDLSENDIQEKIIFPLQRQYSQDTLKLILLWMKNTQKVLHSRVVNREQDEGILKLRQEIETYESYRKDLLQHNTIKSNNSRENKTRHQLLSEYELKIMKYKIQIKEWEYASTYKKWWQSETQTEWGEWKKKIERLDTFLTLFFQYPYPKRKSDAVRSDINNTETNKKMRVDVHSESGVINKQP